MAGETSGSMEIAVTGASGFLGSRLVGELVAGGHGVRRLVRRLPGADDEVRWDPEAGTVDSAGLAGVDAVIHLAGEGIAEHRWSPAQKRKILDSRVRGTTVLAEALAALAPRPAVLLSGSAVGIYGDRGDEVLTESSTAGTGFLAEVCLGWEAATAAAGAAGIRVAHLRTGIALDPGGAALAKLLPLFRFGLGGPIGSGRQWWPWIAADDWVAAVIHLLTAEVSGPVNLTAPEPVTNATFARALGRAMHRPARLPTPLLGPSLLLGRELAAALLGDSLRVVPEQLVESGFRFRHPGIDEALRSLLG
jgi:uncharacterized protein (TIGR01777 family)